MRGSGNAILGYPFCLFRFNTVMAFMGAENTMILLAISMVRRFHPRVHFLKEAFARPVPYYKTPTYYSVGKVSSGAILLSAPEYPWFWLTCPSIFASMADCGTGHNT